MKKNKKNTPKAPQPFAKFHRNKRKEVISNYFEEAEEVEYKPKSDKKPKNKKTASSSPKKDYSNKKEGKKSFHSKPNNKKKSYSQKEKEKEDAPALEAMRLNKYIAHSGICSRRKASEHIKNGEVMINDIVITEMGEKVQPTDIVKFQGKVVKPTRNLVYILLNKPKNVITTLSDEKGRRTIAEFIAKKTKERVYPVGRLDRNTTGLLILTNDGDLAQKLSHPSYEVKKVYKATLDKPLEEADFEKIKNTLQLEDGPAPIDDIGYAHENLKVIGIELHIGRNRIVRRIFEHLGYEVVKLDRVRYSNLTKKNLPVGFSRFLTRKEVIMLKHLV